MTKQAAATGEAKNPPIERRRFLQGFGVAAGGAAAAAGTAALAAEVTESDEEQAKGRYQETDHVKRFYALNRV